MLDVKHCPKPWDMVYVHVNGDVKPCCYSLGRVGRLQSQGDLNAIWHGETMQELREAIINNRIHPVCAGAGCEFVRSRFPQDGSDAGATRSKWTEDAAEFEGLDVDPVTLQRCLHGQRNAMFNVGTAMYRAKRYVPAVKWLERAAEQRLVFAYFYLGRLFVYGWGVRRDIERGREYLIKAAEEDYGPAFTELGLLSLRIHNRRKWYLPPLLYSILCRLRLRDDLVRQRGLEEASNFLRRAVERGDGDGCFHLARLHLSGTGVARDDTEAIRLLRMAARRGNAKAEKKLVELAA